MGLDQYGMIRNGHIDWKKVYSDKYEPMQKTALSGVSMQDCKSLCLKNMQSKTLKKIPMSIVVTLDGLGFNGEDHKVIINKDILKRLDEAIKNDYYDHFASDGFFWGQQFQEEQAKSYKTQDKQFIKFCEDALKKGQTVEYSCSW